MSTCEYTRGTVHSKDLIEMYAGRRTPFTLCGYHATANTVGVMEFVGKQREAQEEAVGKIADFDHPFVVGEDRSVTDATGVHAPEVCHDDEHDITIDGVPMRDSNTWDALVGHTNQYSYNGAVMHPSEFIGRDLADTILAEPGTYVVTSVEVFHDYTEDEHDCPTCGAHMLHVSTSQGEPGEHFVCSEDTCRHRVFFLHDPDVSDEPAGWCILRMKPTKNDDTKEMGA